ncbi:hypothetical protein J7T55_006125 [Diaporthe amygdali]|uniref:uncharacterized protein n=1 Tax=Phomopsis amygdali TaxID=1214568 RepID=UPI0022FE44C4|nr:uncharacterized protein J7T55_006125 [Diaporthe amygdali]KAJ0124784.1 hypothetical protein J7T55_006125 [Diaporthe amygdali]
MDGPIIAATTAALAAATQTAYIVTDFLKDVPPAHSELESVLIELFDLRGFFERLQHLTPPDVLCHPLIGVTRGCTDVCGRIDSVLTGCGDGPLRSGRWALTDASVDIRRFSKALGFCRQTVQFAFEAISRDVSEQTIADIDYVRKHLTPNGLRVARLDALLAHCLDEVENYVAAMETLPADTPETPVAVDQLPPTTPSVHTMMTSFRRRLSDSSEQGEMRPYSATSSELQSISEGSAHSHLGAAPEDGFSDAPGPGPRRLKPSPLQLTVKSLSLGDVRPSPGYSLFPSPPPTKSLPPIPPPKSPHRRNGLSTSTNRAPSIPAKSRSRAASETTRELNRDSKFSSVSEAASKRYSTASSFAKPPVRSSSHTYEPPLASPKPTVSTFSEEPGLEIVPVRRLEPGDKDSSHGVYSIDTSPTSTVLASRHGKTHVNLWDLTSGCELITTIKVSSNVQAQPRSRDNFIRSHAILSETLNLVVIASGFGHTLEIHNWAKRKKVQTISDAYRWAYARQAQSECYPLAAYREDKDTIDLFPSSPPASKKPFGKPRSIELRKAGLPHLPKLPELAYSATGPLLVAAAGPRPPRPNCPPPEHAALLMAWRLDDDAGLGHRPYKFLMPSRKQHPELEYSLALSLVTYGSVAVSVWIPAKFRTIGRPGMWQVEPAVITERVVLVWDFSTDKTTTYKIPDALNCVSPDCRFVAYCDPGTPQRTGGLAVLDAMSGRELWRLGGNKAAGWDGRSVSSRRSGRSSQRSGRSSESEPGGGGAAGLEKLGGDLDRVTELAFSGDGSRLFVGDVDGGVGVYDIREGMGIGREKSLQQDTHYF